MKTKKERRGTAIHNGAKPDINNISRRRLFNKAREAAIKGAFGTAVLTFLIGGASLDADPVAGIIITAVSFCAAAVIYLRNEWGTE